MDLTTIRLEVRERLGELNANFFSDDEVDRAINEAIRHFSSEERWPWLWTELEGDLVAGDDTFDLPSNVPPNRVFNMSVDADSLIGPVMLERVDPRAGFRLRHAYDGHEGCPKFYYVTASNLSEDEAPPVTYTVRVIPTPDLSYEIEAQYVFIPPELSGDSDEPAIPEEYQDAIPAWAAGKLFLKELQISHKAAEQFGIYAEILDKARKEFDEPNTDETVAWGREHPGEGVFMSEHEYVMRRIPSTGLGL